MRAMWCVTIGSALLLCLGAMACAQTVSLEAPAQATIGSKVSVGYQGPGEQYDTISVIAAGADDAAKAINTTSILSGRNPVEVVMPDEPGRYELRYWSRNAKAVIGRRGIDAVNVETVLDAPERVAMGSKLDIDWRGPGNSYEQVQLHPVGAATNAKPLAQSTVLGKSPIRMNLPEVTGEFELRYVTRQTKRVLATRAISLFGIEAGLTAPDVADIGATIDIHWQGPGNQYDQLALFEAGAPAEAKPVKVERILSSRNPVPMRLPEVPGEYELRYLTARDATQLASRPLRIGAVEAALDAPEQATAATVIEVRWQGPGNNYDSIGVYAPDAADGAKPLAQAVILSQRNPVNLKLPASDGRYELRYRTTQSAQVLARRSIAVQPAGRLAVVFERAGEVRTTASGDGAVELILDASGSMLQKLDGKRRIEIARDVLDELVNQHLAENRPFALRVFGHKQADSCRTDLEIALGPLSRAEASATIAGVQAMNLAKTPIADSLAKVPADLAAATGPKTIVLITDGEETCDGDPAATIRALRASGLDVQLSIVGFAIDDAELRSSFETWAELGGGSYFDARSADQLIQSLRTVISGPFRVLDGQGKVVGQGVIGGAEVVLPAGSYTVEAVGRTPALRQSVEIRPRELSTVAF